MIGNKKIYKTIYLVFILHMFNPCLSIANDFTILKKENKYEVLAKFKSFTNVCSAWKIITNYEDLPSFLPRITSRKILKIKGNKKEVEQVIKETIFLFPLHVKNIFLVTEHEVEKKISVKLLSGDLIDYRANWQITNFKGSTVINLYVQLTPTRTQSIILSNKRVRNHFNEMIYSLKAKLNSTNHTYDCKQ